MEWIRNHEVLAVFVPYVSLLVLVFLGILVFVNKSGGRARKRAREKYASCVGRAIARITERREVSKYVGTDSETGHSEYRDSVVVTYEFEVDGQTYQGNGEYSTLKKKITELEVCYDPANPDHNVTLDNMISMTREPRAFEGLFRIIIMLIIAIAVLRGILWLGTGY